MEQTDENVGVVTNSEFDQDFDVAWKNHMKKFYNGNENMEWTNKHVGVTTSSESDQDFYVAGRDSRKIFTMMSKMMERNNNKHFRNKASP